MNLEIFNLPDKSGKFTKESFLIKNYKEEYDYIISSCNIDIPFKEKVYLVINNLKDIPKCKNIHCNNSVKFKNSNIGYKKYCSNKCISSDPEIIKIKQEKSLFKYGTNTPAESTIIKNKIISTNNKRYGGNSPMSSQDIKNKSQKTLINNWKVDNPSKNKDILIRRTSSFKENVEQYKNSYKQTSMDRYGVEHPWMNKDIHNKTIEFFYKEYKQRISSKISEKDFLFNGFEKEVSTNLNFFCKKCNQNFTILTYQFYYRINNQNSICTKCFPISENSSIDQKELFNFIRENYKGVILENVKNIINPFEIDIYLPELKIGFEFNGVYWHSDKFKSPDYHLKKNNLCISNNISLYTIWEDDWTMKKEICQSFILNKIGKTYNSIMARKTTICEVTYPVSKDFLEKNHLQGDCKSSIRIGLFVDNSLVSLMNFSNLRLPMGGKNKQKVYELTRFCNKIGLRVTGGASKLLNYFIKNYNPIEIQTYSDNLISSGNLYEKLGFRYSHTSDIGYWYVIDGIRSHRFNWRKHKLVKMGYDINKTEEEIMLELGHYRIYNAGNKKWIWSQLLKK